MKVSTILEIWLKETHQYEVLFLLFYSRGFECLHSFDVSLS